MKFDEEDAPDPEAVARLRAAFAPPTFNYDTSGPNSAYQRLRRDLEHLRVTYKYTAPSTLLAQFEQFLSPLPSPMCASCGHVEPHIAGGLWICTHPKCGCDGPLKSPKDLLQ